MKMMRSRKECGTKEQDEQEGFLEKVLPILEIVGMVAIISGPFILSCYFLSFIRGLFTGLTLSKVHEGEGTLYIRIERILLLKNLI